MVIAVGILTGLAAFVLGLLIEGWSELRWGFAQDILLD